MSFPKSLVPSLAAVFLLAGMVQGQRVPVGMKRAMRKAQAETQLASDSQLAQAVAVLQQTHTTLKNADHDYGGHRAAATKAVRAAEHQLTLAIRHDLRRAGVATATPVAPGASTVKNQGVAAATTLGAKQAIREPQAVSDAQLAAAIPVLQATKATLEHADHDYGGHRLHAIRDLNQAIGQLELALAYIRKKEK
jgi:hypothetical protein